MGSQHRLEGISQAGECGPKFCTCISQGPLCPLLQLNSPKPFLHGCGFNCLSHWPSYSLCSVHQGFYFSLPYKLK